MSIVLASTSPRRKALLSLLGLPFDVAEPTYVEQVRPGLSPQELAHAFALGKAQSCASRFPDRWVLGSDTLIAVDAEVLGKPADRREAKAMLQRLQGRVHIIYTAVALCHAGRNIHDVEVATVRVWMKRMSDGEIDAYVQTDEWQGKAGAYAIQEQGSHLIERIEGDYTAAVGLPLRVVASLLRKHAIAIPVEIDEVYRTRPYPNWNRFGNQR